MAKVTLPDGSTLEVTEGTTAQQLAEQIGPGLAKAAVAAKVNGQIVDLSTPINGEADVQIITLKDDEALDVMRHSCAHVMAEAISGIWPDTNADPALAKTRIPNYVLITCEVVGEDQRRTHVPGRSPEPDCRT